MKLSKTSLKSFLIIGMVTSGGTTLMFLAGCLWETIEIILYSETIHLDQFVWPIIYLFCLIHSVERFFKLWDEWHQKIRLKEL